MLVVLNCLCNRLNTEPKGSFEFEYKLIVDGPSHAVVVVGLTFRLMELVPWVVLQPLYVDALLWIGLENFREDVLRFWRQELRKIIVCIQNLLVEIWCFLIFKWQITAQHRVEYDTATPYIGLQPMISITGNHLQSLSKSSINLPQVLRSMGYHKQSLVFTQVHTCCLDRNQQLSMNHRNQWEGFLVLDLCGKCQVCGYSEHLQVALTNIC